MMIDQLLCGLSGHKDNPPIIVEAKGILGIVLRKQYLCSRCEAILRQKDYDG